MSPAECFNQKTLLTSDDAFRVEKENYENNGMFLPKVLINSPFVNGFTCICRSAVLQLLYFGVLQPQVVMMTPHLFVTTLSVHLVSPVQVRDGFRYPRQHIRLWSVRTFYLSQLGFDYESFGLNK